MSASELSQAAAPDGAANDDAVEQSAAAEDFKQPESESEATALLRSDWKFAAIVQFCRIFAAPLRLKSFAADTLESALLTPDNHRMFLSELLFKLLRPDASQPYSEKDSEGWESLLYRKVSAKWTDHFDSHPLAGTTFFDTLSTRRISLVFALCDWRAQDCPAVKDVLKQLAESNDSSADLLRHEPIGEDSKGNLYYYFSFNNEDCRLYKQEPPHRKTTKRRRSTGDEDAWDTITTTVEDVADLVQSLSASRNGKERALHDLIATDILPKLVESAAARRRAEEKQAAIEAMPKKRSSRLQELTTKKEEEDRLKAKQKADRLARQKEDERVRKEREREERLLARQREDERQADFQRKLAGIHPEGPSREERAQRRLRSGQAGSSSDSASDMHQADQVQSQHNHPSSSRLSTQQPQHGNEAAAVTQQSQHRSMRHQHADDQPGRQHASQRQPHTHSPHPHDTQQDTPQDQAESNLPRLRPRSSRRRTFQESFAWSPLDTPVPQRRRTDLESKPRKGMAGLLAAAKGMPHSFGRNRRGRWVLPEVPEEDIGVNVRPKPGPKPRKQAVGTPPVAPGSPAASWESGAAPVARGRRSSAASRANFPDVPDRYSLQESQRWPASPPHTASQPTSDPSAWPPGHPTSWQQQQQHLQQQQLRQQQLEHQLQQKQQHQMQQRQLMQQKQVEMQQQRTQAEFDQILAQLTPTQQLHLGNMSLQKRQDFFMNLKNQMLMSKRSQAAAAMSWQQPNQQGPSAHQQHQHQLPGALPMQQANAGHLNQPTQQQQMQQQQFQQHLQQLTLKRLSSQQMQQLQDMPIEHRNMQFGRYMRETQLQLMQHQQMQQQQQMSSSGMQLPAGMPGQAASMSNNGPQQQQQQAQLMGSSMYPSGMTSGMSLQQQRQAQALRQRSSTKQPMLGSQTGIMQQHPYAVHPQAQMLRPQSPPGLPRGPQNIHQPDRGQVKSAAPSQTAASDHPTADQPPLRDSASSFAVQPGLVKQPSTESGSGSLADQQAMFRASQPGAAFSGQQGAAVSNGQGMIPGQGSGNQQALGTSGLPSMQGAHQHGKLGLNVPSMQSAAQHGRGNYPMTAVMGYSPKALPSPLMSGAQSTQQSMQGHGMQSMQRLGQHSMQSISQPSMVMPGQQSMPGTLLNRPSMHMLGQQNMRMTQPNMSAMQQSMAQQQQSLRMSQQTPGSQNQSAVLQGTSPRMSLGSGADPNQPGSSFRSEQGTGGLSSSPRVPFGLGASASSPRLPRGSSSTPNSPRAIGSSLRAPSGSGSIPNSPVSGNSPRAQSPATKSGNVQPLAWQLGAAGQLPGPAVRFNPGLQHGTASAAVQGHSNLSAGTAVQQQPGTSAADILSAQYARTGAAQHAMPQHPSTFAAGSMVHQQAGMRAAYGRSPSPAGDPMQTQQAGAPTGGMPQLPALRPQMQSAQLGQQPSSASAVHSGQQPGREAALQSSLSGNAISQHVLAGEQQRDFATATAGTPGGGSTAAALDSSTESGVQPASVPAAADVKTSLQPPVTLPGAAVQAQQPAEPSTPRNPNGIAGGQEGKVLDSPEQSPAAEVQASSERAYQGGNVADASRKPTFDQQASALPPEAHEAASDKAFSDAFLA